MRCVHCAEEIQDEARVCKHCGRPVPIGALQIDYRGERFGLGTTEDRYAIWDLTAGGPPAAEFDKTPEGWSQAWARHQAWGGQAPPAAGPVVTQAPRTNGKAIAALVLGLVGLVIGSILALILGYQARTEIRGSGGTQSGDGFAIAGIVLGWIGIGGIVLLIIVFASIDASLPSY